MTGILHTTPEWLALQWAADRLLGKGSDKPDSLAGCGAPTASPVRLVLVAEGQPGLVSLFAPVSLLCGLAGDAERQRDLGPRLALFAQPFDGAGDPVVDCSHLADTFGDSVEVLLSGAQGGGVVAGFPAAVGTLGHASIVLDTRANVKEG